MCSCSLSFGQDNQQHAVVDFNTLLFLFSCLPKEIRDVSCKCYCWLLVWKLLFQRCCDDLKFECVPLYCFTV